MALAGCMAIDVADIVIKGRHPLTRARGADRRRAARGSAAPLRPASRCISWSAATCRSTRSSARSSCRATSTARCGTRCGRTSTLDTTFEVDPGSVRSISTGCAASRSSSWSARTSPTRGRASEDRGRSALHVHGLHRRPGGAAVPVPRRPDALDGGVGARVEGRSRRGGVAWRAGAGCRCSRSRSCSACSRSCSAGARSINFLKVDILNVMGIAMIAAAMLWSAVVSIASTRIVLFAIATVAVAMSTPLVREAGVLAVAAGCDRGLHPAAAGPHQLRAVSVGGLSARRRDRRRAGLRRADATRRSGGCRPGC